MKNKMWRAAHLAHWAALYAAFAVNIEGAMYVVKFFVWAMVPFAPLMLTTMVQEKGAQDAPTPVRAALSRVQAWATLLLLVWFGHIATAVAWCVVMFCVGIYREGAKKKRAEFTQAVV